MDHERAIIIGAGPIGIACAISAKQRGLDPLLVDAGPIVNSIVRYPTQMIFFTTPELLEIGGHPFPCASHKPNRNEALEYYRGVVRNEGLRVRTHTRFTGAVREDDTIRCSFTGEDGPLEIDCDRLVLATGYFDQPKKLGVPGEELPHVSCRYDEGHGNYCRDVVVIGGGNSGVEAALDLFRSGARVTMVHRGKTVKKTVKYWMRPDFENRVAAGEIDARYDAEVLRFGEKCVTIRTPAGEETVRADRVYCLIGFLPDQSLFRALGIDLDPDSGRPSINRDTQETNVPGVYLAGSPIGGKRVSEIFIENGRFDGEKIFSDLPVPGESQ